MREWTRAPRALLCGRCSVQLLAGDPVQMITLAKVKESRYRCPACADGEVPPDLPVLETARTTKRMQPLSVAIPGVIEKLRP
jgi:ribosomal protein S27AE